MRLLLFLTLHFFSAKGYGQIEIVVKDLSTSYPLKGTMLQWESGNAITNPFGKATIQLPKEGATAITFRHLGYESKTIAIGQSQVVWLQPSTQELQAAEVVAFQSGKRISEVPAAITQLLANKLKQDDGLDLGAALNRVPGVLFQNGAFNTNRLTIRGMGARSQYATSKIKVYVAGVPITDGSGETTLENWDMEFMGKTEVIRGPASSLYGTALGGTILFGPQFQPSEKRTAFSFSHQQGSFGTQRTVISGNFRNEQSALLATGSYSCSDGFRQNSEFGRFNFSTLGTWFTPAGNSWSVVWNLAHMDAHIPSSISQSAFETTPDAAARNWLAIGGYEKYWSSTLGITHKHRLGQKSELSTTVFFQGRDAEELRPWDVLQEANQRMGLRAIIEKSFTTGNAELKWLAGTESQLEWYQQKNIDHEDGTQTDLLAEGDQHRSGINFFSQLSAEIGRWRVQAGLNLNMTHYRYTDQFLADGDQSGNYSYDPILSPRVGLSYSLSPSHSVFAQISQGFSPPTLEETLLPEGEINPSIQPEVGWNIEVGYRYFQPDNKWSVEVVGYRMLVSDLLVSLRTAEDRYIGRNAGKTTHQGIESRLQVNWLNQTNWQWQQTIGYTYNHHRFTDFVDDETDYSGNNLTGVPANQFSLENVVSFRRFTFQFQGLFVDEMPLRDDNTAFSESYLVWHSRLDWKRDWGKANLHLSFGVRNLADRNYASMVLVNAPSFGSNPPRYFYPANPRSFYASLKVGI